MIDFKNNSVFKLSSCDPADVADKISPLLVADETIVAPFKAVRDFVVFTDRRLITVNVQGMTGKRTDFTSLPYNKIQAFSVETAGTFDMEAELDLWFSSLGLIKLEFKGSANVQQISQIIAAHAL